MGKIINPYVFGAGGGGPPTDPNLSYRVLLMHGQGSNGSTVFTNERYPTRGTTMTSATGSGVALSTTDPLYGSSCILFGGPGSGAGFINQTAASADYPPGTNDFMLECACRTSVPSQLTALYDLRSTSGEQGPQLGMFGGQFFIFNTSGLFQVFGTVAMDAYQWPAYFRSAGVGYCFLDGHLETTVADTVNYNNSGGVTLGAAFNAGNPYTGRLAEIRYTNGLCEFTADYTLQAAPYPDI